VQGRYQIKPPFPFTPGAEVSGIVDAVGDEVTQIRVGDRVAAMPHGGGFAEFSIAPASSVFAIPEKMSFAEAAAMPIAYHTSYFALTHRTALRSGEWLLVHAGASGVGMSAIQIGKALGARVIATAGSEAKRTFAARQGADHVLDYSDEGWCDRVKEITAGGANVIYDPVGGDIFDLSAKCIASEGRLLVIGFAGGRIASIAANRILLKNISVVGVFWGGYVQAHREYPRVAQEALIKMYAAEEIHPCVGATYPLSDVPRGLGDLRERKVVGKAVIGL